MAQIIENGEQAAENYGRNHSADSTFLRLLRGQDGGHLVFSEETAGKICPGVADPGAEENQCVNINPVRKTARPVEKT